MIHSGRSRRLRARRKFPTGLLDSAGSLYYLAGLPKRV